MKKIYIAALTESGICDIFTSLTEKGLLDKLVNVYAKGLTFNTLQEFQDYIYGLEDFNGCELFFDEQELDLSK